jgi:ABC-type transporter Mla subunit MlaD
MIQDGRAASTEEPGNSKPTATEQWFTALEARFGNREQLKEDLLRAEKSIRAALEPFEHLRPQLEALVEAQAKEVQAVLRRGAAFQQILADTSPAVAWMRQNQQHHERVLRALEHWSRMRTSVVMPRWAHRRTRPLGFTARLED